MAWLLITRLVGWSNQGCGRGNFSIASASTLSASTTWWRNFCSKFFDPNSFGQKRSPDKSKQAGLLSWVHDNWPRTNWPRLKWRWLAGKSDQKHILLSPEPPCPNLHFVTKSLWRNQWPNHCDETIAMKPNHCDEKSN